MALSMYQASVPIYIKMLNGLATCLKKAAAHYAENKWDETSLAELIARVEQTVAFMQTVKPAQIDGSEEKAITRTRRDVSVDYSGLQFLLHRSMPNFCFHCTTAYNILRHNGVAVGKRDYLGPN